MEEAHVVAAATAVAEAEVETVGVVVVTMVAGEFVGSVGPTNGRTNEDKVGDIPNMSDGVAAPNAGDAEVERDGAAVRTPDGVVEEVDEEDVAAVAGVHGVNHTEGRNLYGTTPIKWV